MIAVRRFSSVLVLLILSLPVSAGVGVWTPLGPDGGEGWSVAVDPVNADVVYLGTRGGVFKSTDGGETWAAASAGLPPEGAWVRAILVRPGAVFAGTQDGVIYRSTNGGASWVRSSTGISSIPPEHGPGIGSLSSDPKRPARIWAGARKGLYSSTDNGATWTTRYVGRPFDNPVTGIAIDPVNGQIYIASSRRGVYTSTNLGKSWTQVSSGLRGASYSDLVLDPQNPAILHVAAATGLWRSDNRGGRWTRVPAVSGLVSALVYQGSRLYAASMTAGLFYSDDQGRTWTATLEKPGGLVADLAAGSIELHAASSFVGVPSFGGVPVYRSLDRGETWEASHRGVDSLGVRAVTVSPADGNVLYAYGWEAGMFKSLDRGATWQHLDFGEGFPVLGPPLQTILVDRANPSTVYGGAGLGRGSLVRSTDAGATWAERFSLGVEDLESDPGAAGTVWAAGYVNLSNDLTALFRSVNHGEDWLPVAFPGGSSAWIRAFEIDPTNPQVLWAAGGVWQVTQPLLSRLFLRIYRSTDGGLTWESRNGSASSGEVPAGVGVEDLAIDPASPNRLYLATTGGLYRTTDAGLTWTLVPGLPGARALEVEVAPTTPTTVYVSLSGIGVRRSADGGATWSAVSAGLGAMPLFDLIVDPTNPRRLYAGTATRSVFTYEEPAP